MNYRGLINLDKELSYSQAKEVESFCKTNTISLEITSDGRALQWNRVETNFLAQGALKVLKLLLSWRINAYGVINASGTKEEEKYDIIILGKKVKIYIYKKGSIKDIKA